MSTAFKKPVQTNGSRPSNPANQTLYLTNINDKINKNDLRRALYALFSTYGPVLDVVALKTMKMRGQAHVVYRDVQTSTQAMRALQGFNLFDKEMRIQYGKGKSGIISRLDGTAKIPEVVKPANSSNTSDLARSIFAAPPGAGDAREAPGGAAPTATTIPIQQGIKRSREEDDEEVEAVKSVKDAVVEADDDEGGSEMEMSDDE